MRRGDLVLISPPGDYGQPRPALIVQTNLFAEHPSVTVSLVTSHLIDAPLFRYQVTPSSENGLSLESQVQIDKMMTVPRQKLGNAIGHLSAKQMSEVTKLLAFWVGVAD